MTTIRFVVGFLAIVFMIWLGGNQQSMARKQGGNVFPNAVSWVTPGYPQPVNTQGGLNNGSFMVYGTYTLAPQFTLVDQSVTWNLASGGTLHSLALSSNATHVGGTTNGVFGAVSAGASMAKGTYEGRLVIRIQNNGVNPAVVSIEVSSSMQFVIN